MPQVFSQRKASIKTMYKILQNLEKQVKEIFALSSSTREIQFKRARHMEELNNSIKLFKKKIRRWK